MKILPCDTVIKTKLETISPYIENEEYVVITNGEVIYELSIEQDGISISTNSENRFYEFKDENDMSDLEDLYFIVAKKEIVIANN